MKQATVRKLLEKTQKDYDTIAQDFSQTRRYLWPGLSQFKKFIKPGDKILDLGCGNGKLRLLFKDLDIDYIGVDFSKELLKLAEASEEFRLNKQKFINSQVFELPIADNTFDAIYFDAVFHHLPGEELRLKTLREIKRVLKPDGILIMTNWNRWKKDTIKHIIKYTLLKIIGKNEMDFKDILLPWMKGKAYRYYHAFTLGELKRLVKKSGLELKENYLSYWDKEGKSKIDYFNTANIVTIAKKC